MDVIIFGFGRQQAGGADQCRVVAVLPSTGIRDTIDCLSGRAPALFRSLTDIAGSELDSRLLQQSCGGASVCGLGCHRGGSNSRSFTPVRKVHPKNQIITYIAQYCRPEDDTHHSPIQECVEVCRQYF